MKIEFFYALNCSRCPEARRVLAEVVAELGGEIELEEFDALSPEGKAKVQAYRLLVVPATVLDGEVKLQGVLSAEMLREAILRQLNRGDSRFNPRS